VSAQVAAWRVGLGSLLAALLSGHILAASAYSHGAQSCCRAPQPAAMQQLRFPTPLQMSGTCRAADRRGYS